MLFRTAVGLSFQRYLQRDPVSLCPCQHLRLSTLKIIVVVCGYTSFAFPGWLVIVTIFFTCLFDICLSLLFFFFFMYFTHFLIFFFNVEFLNFLYEMS